MLTFKIQADGKESVNVNIPVGLFKRLLKIGHVIMAQIAQVREYADDIDIDLLIDAIDQEKVGKVFDVQPANRDMVTVYIE